MTNSPITHDLRGLWDLTKACANPHKGWYHHYYDNGTDKYGLRSDDDLVHFPGMDHLYVRLSWAHFEPREGVFDWHWIDDLVAAWVPRGKRLCVRVSCKETEETWATPAWVRDAGAEGELLDGPNRPMWVPRYDDPVFLAKLEAFHRAFAARYASQHWLAYIDIGSIGTWGEGHEYPAGRRATPQAIARILDLHLACYPGVILVVPDELAHFERPPEEEAIIRPMVESRGICWRDDTPLVGYFMRKHPDTHSVVKPDYFASTYRTRPVILETDHYPLVKQQGNWRGRNGSEMGGACLRGALELMHATYIGYHGRADEWLQDNPELAVELLNRCGYWYAPESVTLPLRIAAGAELPITIAWRNLGLAPAYHRYVVELRLHGPGSTILRLDGCDNRTWLDGAVTAASARVVVPATLPPGQYDCGLRLRDESTGRTVELALASATRDAEGFHRLASLELIAG